MRTRGAVAGLALAVGLLAGACTGGDATPGPTEPSPAQRLAAAKAKVDQTPAVHLVLASKDLPSDVSGVVAADGSGTHPPAFKGTLTIKAVGLQASADVVAVDGKVYAKLPFTSVFAPVDPASLGVPDPASLFDPGTGITSLLTATENPAKGAQVRKGDEVLTTVAGSLPGSRVADLLRVGDRAGSFTATYGITDPGGELRTVELTGPFYPGSRSTYSLTLDRYGAPVDITKP